MADTAERRERRHVVRKAEPQDQRRMSSTELAKRSAVELIQKELDASLGEFHNQEYMAIQRLESKKEVMIADYVKQLAKLEMETAKEYEDLLARYRREVPVPRAVAYCFLGAMAVLATICVWQTNAIINLASN